MMRESVRDSGGVQVYSGCEEMRGGVQVMRDVEVMGDVHGTSNGVQ